MNRIFDPKMYEDYAARHKLETEWSCLLHAEFKNAEGDIVMIGDSRVYECVIARIVASIAYNSKEQVGEIMMRVHMLAREEYKNKLLGGSI